jgi:hypothetical protein
MKYSRFELLLFCGIMFLILAPQCYSYVDAGTGSYIVQIVVAFVFGTVFTFKSYMAKAVQSIKKLFKHEHVES